MPDLSDKRVWDDLLVPFAEAKRQLTERAARDVDEHLRALGKLEGLEHALMLLVESRKRLMKLAGDYRPD